MTDTLPLLVFSDLDGTLLDHDSYDFSAAQPALDALGRIGAGVVLATSKTAREVAALRSEMGLSRWPAIIENGAGVLPPGADATGDDTDYRAIRAALTDLPGGFTGFGDMTAEEVAAITGLSLEAAQAAKTRCHSEPGLWTGEAAALDGFLNAARAAGLNARRGGRFLTLSLGGTKADRMDAITRRLRPRHTVALGDAPNDVEMLIKAEFGIIIANPHAPTLPRLDGEAEGRIRRTDAPGPQGWSDAIFALLSKLGFSQEAATHG